MPQSPKPVTLGPLQRFGSMAVSKAGLFALSAVSETAGGKAERSLRRALENAARSGDPAAFKKALARGARVSDPKISWVKGDLVHAVCSAHYGSLDMLRMLEQVGVEIAAPFKTRTSVEHPARVALLNGNFSAGAYLFAKSRRANQGIVKKQAASPAPGEPVPADEYEWEDESIERENAARFALWGAMGAGQRAAHLDPLDPDPLDSIDLSNEVLAFFKTLDLPLGVFKNASPSCSLWGEDSAPMASASPHPMSLKILADLGADPNEPTPHSLRTALHRACEYLNPECVSFLLLINANPLALDSLGKSPLSIALEAATRVPRYGDRHQAHMAQLRQIVTALRVAGARMEDTDAVLDSADRVNLGLPASLTSAASPAPQAPSQPSAPAATPAAEEPPALSPDRIKRRIGAVRVDPPAPRPPQPARLLP